MNVLRSALVFVSLLAGWSGCAGTGDAFTVDPQEFDRMAGTMVLAPVVVTADIEVPESVLTYLDSLIESHIRQAGIAYVPSEEYTVAWNRILDLMGGLTDSAGSWIETKMDVAREQLVRDLSETREIESLLFPEIWLVEAEVADGVARWDGASEGMVSFGARILGAFLSLMNGTDGDLPQGVVSALSLGVIVESVGGAELYAHAGGIQVLEKVGREESDRRPVEPDELFGDRSRLDKAVRTALEPLTTRRSP